MDRLLREGDPPVGQIASPKPQYKKAGSDPVAYEPVEGQHGAPFASLVDTDGKPITPASETTLAALEAELGLVKAELAAVKQMLTDGTAKGQVTLSGTIHEDVIATNFTVLAGTTQYYYASIPPAARYWGVWLRATQIDGKLDVIARPKYKDVGQYADSANSEVMIKGKTGATYNYPATAMGSLQVPGVLFMLQETSGSADAQLTEFTLWAVM